MKLHMVFIFNFFVTQYLLYNEKEYSRVLESERQLFRESLREVIKFLRKDAPVKSLIECTTNMQFEFFLGLNTDVFLTSKNVGNSKFPWIHETIECRHECPRQIVDVLVRDFRQALGQSGIDKKLELFLEFEFAQLLCNFCLLFGFSLFWSKPARNVLTRRWEKKLMKFLVLFNSCLMLLKSDALVPT